MNSSSSRQQLRSSSSSISRTSHNNPVFGGGSTLRGFSPAPRGYPSTDPFSPASPPRNEVPQYYSQRPEAYYTGLTVSPSTTDRGRSSVPRYSGTPATPSDYTSTSRSSYSSPFSTSLSPTDKPRPSLYSYENAQPLSRSQQVQRSADPPRSVHLDATTASSSMSSSTAAGSALRRSPQYSPILAHRSPFDLPTTTTVPSGSGARTPITSVGRSEYSTSGVASARPVGLPNLGNTCYLNSVLQCVLQLDQFVSSLIEARRSCTRKSPLTEVFDRLSKELSSSSERRNLVSYIKTMMGKRNSEFACYYQADAHELLRTLLFAMHEELNRTSSVSYMELKDIPNERPLDTQRRWLEYHKRRDDSVIYDHFGGVVKAETRCDSCGFCSFAFDPFLDLSIAFDKRLLKNEGYLLGDMLHHLWEPEPIDKLQAWKCLRCNVVRSALRTLSLLTEPRILVLHLKRFNSRGVKVESPVLFPNRLRTSTKTYALKGVVCHSGTANSGHYTAYVSVGNSSSSGDWYYCSDSTIERSSARDVLGVTTTTTAFMLFYEADSR